MEAIAQPGLKRWPSPLKVGSRLDSYEITRVLATAGVTAVYRARHVGTGDEVALKFLPSEIAEEDTERLRFLREAQSARALVHPAIVRVRDVGETKQGLYIAMDYVAGRDLGRLLAQHGPLAPPQVVWMLAWAANALHAAHQAGIIHRDVKPSNILVASGDARHADGTCLLTDFGFSIAPSRDIRRLTEAGTFVGSVAYAAPEQVSGEASGPSRRRVLAGLRVMRMPDRLTPVPSRAAHGGRHGTPLRAAAGRVQPPSRTAAGARSGDCQGARQEPCRAV